MWQFRRGLISALRRRGAQVFLITPDGPYVPRLTALGAVHIPVPMNRFVTPGGDLTLLYRLYRVFRSIRPDIVHTMTIKPNIYGSMAARWAGVPRVVGLVSGLGYAFQGGDGWKGGLLRRAARFLYRTAGRCSDRIWFQNSEDLDFFVESGLLPADKGLVIRSGGINLDEYRPGGVSPELLAALRSEIGITPSRKVVVMAAARAVRSKGVLEYVEAGRIAAGWPDPPIFLLAAPVDPDSPDPIHASDLRDGQTPTFRWLGFRADAKNLLALADVVVLPSYYREGVPRVLLEGLALGKPLVTTDHVGCRETVTEGVNGYRVPVRDARALASAIRDILVREDRRVAFGRESRRKAEDEFDEKAVAESVLRDLYRW